MTTEPTLSRAIFFASLLVAGAIVFLAGAAFDVEWVAPSVAMIVLAAIGWDRFMNQASAGGIGDASDVQPRDFTIDVDGTPGVIQANRIVISRAAPHGRKGVVKAVSSRRPRKPVVDKAVP